MTNVIKHITIIALLLLPLSSTVVRADEPCVEYSLRVVTTNPVAGNVVVLQEPSCDNNNTAIVEAVPNEGYKFEKWTDGNTDNPRTITLERNWTLIATWSELPCTPFTLVATSTYTIAGIVVVIQEPTCENQNTAIVEAVANEHYRFVSWTDGDTDNPRTLQLTKDTRLFATWEQIPCDTFLLSIESNNVTLGTISILQEPRCENENTAVISVTPAQGCDFVEWSDGIQQSTRVLQLTQDTNLTAIFSNTIYYIVAAANNDEFGYVTGSGTYVYGMEVKLNAYSRPGYRFDHWSDGNTDNPRVIQVDKDADFTAVFVPEYHTLVVQANNHIMGSATGSGTYQENTYVTISAIANSGYEFLSWNDGNKQAEREILLLNDATYTAYFGPITALDNILEEEIRIADMTIYFTNCHSTTLTILSINGQTIYSGPMIEQITIASRGLYLIQTDNATTRIML